MFFYKIYSHTPKRIADILASRPCKVNRTAKKQSRKNPPNFYENLNANKNLLWYNIGRYYTSAGSPSDRREDIFPGEPCASAGGTMSERHDYNIRKT